MADIHTSNHLDTPIEQEVKNKENESSNLQSKIKTLTATGLLALSISNPAFAESPSFTTYTGEVITFQELENIIFTSKGEQIVDNMNNKDYTDFSKWQDTATAKLNTDTARRQENINEQNQIQATYQADIDRQNEIQARQNEIQATYQADIDRQNEIQARQNEIQASNRVASSTAQNFSIMQNILMGNKNIYTFQQIAKAFDEVASDSSLNISDRSRQVYKTISQAYAQGNTLVYVSDEIKQAFVNYAQEVEKNIQVIPAEYRESILSGVEGVMQLSKI